jgi:hypothetical protein
LLNSVRIILLSTGESLAGRLPADLLDQAGAHLCHATFGVAINLQPGGRRGGLYIGESGTGSMAAARRLREPPSTPVCGGNMTNYCGIVNSETDTD